MRHTWIYLWLWCFNMLAQVLATTTIEWSSNIDDHEPAASVLIPRNISKNEPNLESLDRVFDLYNVGRLARVWPDHLRTITETCDTKMRMYLEAYRKRENWALRMMDASARYGSGYFWGNTYWLGSETSCENIGANFTQELAHAEEPSKPPYELGFFKLKIRLNLPHDLHPNNRSILLGLCIPMECTGEDAASVLTASLLTDPVQGRHIHVLQVRTPHEYYRMWHDRTFWILVGVTSVISVLIIIGTLIDLCSPHERQMASFFHQNYTYEISRVVDDPTDMKNNRSVFTITNQTQLNNNNQNLPQAEAQKTTSTIRKQGYLESIMLSFSIRRNLRTICDRSVGEDTIPTIHGLRSISMAWVILGHTCIVIFKYSDNMEFRNLMEQEFFFQTINNAGFSVDTFFFISGLLVSYLYFRTIRRVNLNQLTRSSGILSRMLQFIGLVWYRYSRLTVPYMFILGVVEVTMKWFRYNSVFEPPTMDHENCPNYWWRNALYINTLFPVQDMCMLWSWYLADDTQFYILGIILLLIASSHLRTAAVALVAFMISSWGTTAYIAYINNHKPSEDDPLALFDKIYDKPWTRLGPYLVGMCVGWFLCKVDCKLKMNRLVCVVGWCLSFSCLLALVFGLYGAELSRETSAAYSSLSHTAWALGLSWIVIACSTGYGGYVNKLLSLSILYPFSRVTYCAYLLHPIVIRLLAMKLDAPMHLSKDFVMFVFFGQVVVSYFLSFVVSLMFEAPMVSLLKIVSPVKRNRTDDDDTSNTVNKEQ